MVGYGKRIFITLMLVVACTACRRHGPAESASSPGELPAPAFDTPGSYTVRVKDFPALNDASRKRRVPIKVLYPDANGRFPLVVFSHGGGGNRDGNLYQAEHLASHGYVVLCLEHVRSNNVQVKFYMSRKGGRMKFIDALRRTIVDPDAVLQRPLDVRFAIDRAVVWNRSDPDLADKINTSRIGLIGHSFGAYTTLVCCGARTVLDFLDPPVSPGKGLSPDLSDPRITFGFAMSPQAPGGCRFNRDSYNTIDRPLVLMTGSKDHSQIYRGGARDGKTLFSDARLELLKLIPGEKNLLWLDGADHLCFSDGPRAWILPSKPRKDAQRISKAMMLLFCNKYLKDDPIADTFLNETYANTLTGNVVTRVRWLKSESDVARCFPNHVFWDGMLRRFHVYVPESARKSGKPVPLIMALHGGGGTGGRFPELTLGRFKTLAGAEGFAVAYPDGFSKQWNDGRVVKGSRAHEYKVDDVGFLCALIDRLVSKRIADPDRVYVTGISNGGMMAYRLAVDAPDKIAAMGCVSTAMPLALAEKHPSRPVPLVILSGMNDPFVPWEGGFARFRIWRFGKFHNRGRILSQADTLTYWLKWNKVAGTPVVNEIPDNDPNDGTRVRKEIYPAAPGGADVVRYVIDGGGHTWAGGKQYLPAGIIGKTCRDINACDVLWTFFKKHARK